MSRLVSLFLITIFLNTWAGDEVYSQDKGEWVARQVQDRDTGKDGRSTIRMRLFDRFGFHTR